MNAEDVFSFFAQLAALLILIGVLHLSIFFVVYFPKWWNEE